MIRQEFDIAGVHGYRYPGDGPYSVLLCHGFGGHGGMYDKWAIHHRDHFRTDIWSWDMPGFGMSGSRGHIDASATYSTLTRLVAEILSRQDKPLFLMGSSFGVFIASAGLCIEGVFGAIGQAGVLIPGAPLLTMMRALCTSPPMQAFLTSPIGQACWINTDEVNNADENYGDPTVAAHMKNDPNRLEAMKLSEFATLAGFSPPHSLSTNNKPFLMVVAEFDRMLGGLAAVRTNFNFVGGPTTLLIREGSNKHQIMLSETEWFSEQVDAWCMSSMKR